MDCLILKNRGQGVISHLTKALDEAEFGKALWFRPSEGSSGLDEIIATRISEKPNEPIHLAIDLDHEDLRSWDMALLSIITSRAVGGQQLPKGSSIIVASNLPVAELQSNLSVATIARVVVVDLQSQTPEKFVANHAETIKDLVKVVVDTSFEEVTGRKSGTFKAIHPDAVDVKMAGKPGRDDLSTYPEKSNKDVVDLKMADRPSSRDLSGYPQEIKKDVVDLKMADKPSRHDLSTYPKS